MVAGWSPYVWIRLWLSGVVALPEAQIAFSMQFFSQSPWAAGSNSSPARPGGVKSYGVQTSKGAANASQLPKKRQTGVQLALQIVQKEGIRGLYRGFGASIATFVPSSAIWYRLTETISTILASVQGDPLLHEASGQAIAVILELHRTAVPLKMAFMITFHIGSAPHTARLFHSTLLPHDIPSCRHGFVSSPHTGSGEYWI